VVRAIEVERVVQEFRIIQDSMRVADEHQSASRLTDSPPLYKDLAAGSLPSYVDISLLSFSLDPAAPASPAPAPPAPASPAPAPAPTSPAAAPASNYYEDLDHDGLGAGPQHPQGQQPPDWVDNDTDQCPGQPGPSETAGCPSVAKVEAKAGDANAEADCKDGIIESKAGGAVAKTPCEPPPPPSPPPPPAPKVAPAPPPPKADSAPPPPETAKATPAISSGGREAVKDGASPKEAVAEAKAAGENAGASKAAATAGAQSAVSLALIDGTMTNSVVTGYVTYNDPPEEMQWKDSTDMELVLSPSMSNSMEELKQKLEQVKDADKVEVGTVEVSQRMEAEVFSTKEPVLDVSSITGDSQQPIISEGDTEWRWKVVASNTGDKDLHLKLSIGLSSPQEGDSFSFRPVEGFPVSYENISVKGTPWQNASSFVGSNWQWLWTAILIPLVAFLWGRRKKSSKSEDKGFVGSSWQWLRMTIIVPVAAFLRGRRKQSDKNKDIE
jgi:hypothetical protein